MSSPRFITLIIISFLWIVTLFANDADSITVITIPRVSGEIIFDGMPHETAWDAIDPFPMIMHSPVFGKEPTEKTDIRLTYDEDYLYVGASMFDNEPSKIQITSKKRDEMGSGSDWFSLILDTYNDNENAVAFFTTPAGLRTDMTIYNDGNGEMPLIPSWNTFWYVKTVINDRGWFLEMRIPISSLRFQDVNGQVTMGMIVWRWIPRLNEQYIYPAISQDWGDMSAMKPSKAQKIIFTGLSSKKPLYITPYVLTGITQENNLNESETEYVFENNPKFEAGLDVKYGITSNLTMDLTLNTDFAQVEADDEMVNLTRYSLFYPEKRQFFLERSSIFEFNTGGPSSLFYSRRIGLDDDFNPVRIYGGTRLIGRKGPWDIGFLNMQTAKSDSLPSENFGILRLKRQVVNPYSYAGCVVTSRLGMDGSFNEVYGFDTRIRVFGDDYIKLIWAQSFDNEIDNNPFTLDISRYMIDWERKRVAGFNYDFFITGAGEKFYPEMGFEYHEDYHMFGLMLKYFWIMDEKSPLIRHGFYLNNMNYINQSRMKQERVSINPKYEFQFKGMWMGVIGVDYNRENIFETFELSDNTEVPIGEYEYLLAEGQIYTPVSKPFFTYLTFNAGSYYDGDRISVSVTPIWSVSSSLELSGTYMFNRLVFSCRDQEFTGHIGRLKALYMFSTKLSVSAFVQYNSEISGIISNFRFRYNPREGNDLYIVYNEGTNTDLNREIPGLPRMSDQTIALKYTYTFTFNMLSR